MIVTKYQFSIAIGNFILNLWYLSLAYVHKINKLN